MFNRNPNQIRLWDAIVEFAIEYPEMQECVLWMPDNEGIKIYRGPKGIEAMTMIKLVDLARSFHQGLSILPYKDTPTSYPRSGGAPQLISKIIEDKNYEKL